MYYIRSWYLNSNSKNRNRYPTNLLYYNRRKWYYSELFNKTYANEVNEVNDENEANEKIKDQRSLDALLIEHTSFTNKKVSDHN